MEKVDKKIEIYDNDHIYMDGKQYISLQRFSKLKTDQLNEIDILEAEIERLQKENEAYKVILNRE